MSSSNVARSSSWCPTAANIAAFHQQTNRALTHQPAAEQLHLGLPRFNFGNVLKAALRDQEWRWENREVTRDRREIALEEAAEAAEQEAIWREWCEDHQAEIINQNGGVL